MAIGCCSTTPSRNASISGSGRRKHQDQHRRFIAKKAIPAPQEPRCRPVWTPPQERPELDFRAAGITSVVWCIGFRTDYSWMDLPIFNGRGQPAHVRGVTPLPGVYFLGLPWLYTWGSGRFFRRGARRGVSGGAHQG
jgi:hypothetical protein